VSIAPFALVVACTLAGRPVHVPIPAVQAGAEVVLEGVLEILVEDSPPDSRVLYFLVIEHRRIPLRFARQPANLTTGTAVRIRGRWAKDETFFVSQLVPLK